MIKYSFDFPIDSYPFVDTLTIPLGPAYGVYISHLIATARASGKYEDFKICHINLCFKLMQQGFADKICKLLMKTQKRLTELFTVINGN